MSALGNIISCKCPNCGDAYVFTNQNPYNLWHLADMHQNCPKCGKSFSKEPGFYFGAMYVSYGLTSGIVIVFSQCLAGVLTLLHCHLLALLQLLF
ncbi:MAG: hypothetical protein M0D57_18195 [Sphingobacteriales bacterium JAD_PAG50586_3]|nr:MAG: hypothetical protein M0D57_18195 [Sphingobacteriales bacterium JAD_PAG50586_3]